MGNTNSLPNSYSNLNIKMSGAVLVVTCVTRHLPHTMYILCGHLYKAPLQLAQVTKIHQSTFINSNSSRKENNMTADTVRVQFYTV